MTTECDACHGARKYICDHSTICECKDEHSDNWIIRETCLRCILNGRECFNRDQWGDFPDLALFFCCQVIWRGYRHVKDNIYVAPIAKKFKKQGHCKTIFDLYMVGQLIALKKWPRSTELPEFDCDCEQEYICKHLTICDCDKKRSPWSYRHSQCLYCQLFEKRKFDDQWEFFDEVCINIVAEVIRRGYFHAMDGISHPPYRTGDSYTLVLSELYEFGQCLYFNQFDKLKFL